MFAATLLAALVAVLVASAVGYAFSEVLNAH